MPRRRNQRADAPCMLPAMDVDDPTESRSNTLRAIMPTGGHVLALAVLLGSLVLVFTAWRYARERELRAAEIEFIAKTGEVSDLLRQRMVNYELVTRGGASLFASVARPTPRQWHGYVDGMNIGEPVSRRWWAWASRAMCTGGRLDDLQTGVARSRLRPAGGPPARDPRVLRPDPVPGAEDAGERRSGRLRHVLRADPARGHAGRARQR